MGGQGSGRKVGCTQPCGTQTKYNWHWRRNETCQICKEAVAAIARANYVPKLRAIRPSPAVRKQDRKDWLIDQKMTRVACLDCGLKVEPHMTYVFDYDHRDPHLKSFTISQHLHSYTEYVLLQEMSKCDLVCANCHRHRTNNQQRTGILTGYRKDRGQQQTLICQELVPTLF
jgi:L-lysine 2,3-aminomutase